MARKPSALQGAAVVGGRYLNLKRQENPDGRMPLLSHLAELRNRLIKAAIVLIVGMIVALVFSNQTWTILTRPFCQATIGGRTGCKVVGDKLTITGIFDSLFLRIQIAFFLGLIGTSPVWLYQLWAFIAPGLYSREKKWAYLFVGSAVPLFLGGAALAYLVMDRGLRYLLGLAPNDTALLPTADTYFGYFTGMLIGFGVAFELPLVLIMLNMAGIFDPRAVPQVAQGPHLRDLPHLRAGQPGPDPWTMLLLGGLCVILVEIAEVFVYFNDKRRARLHPPMYENLSDDEMSPLDVPDSVDADNTSR